MLDRKETRVIRLQRCLCFPLPTPSFPAPPFSHARWWLCVRWLCVRRELCCDPIMCDRGLLAAIRRNRNRSLHERAKDCMQLLDGTELHSQADVDVSQLRTIQSQRKRIFNFGLFKSGSTSLQLAISWSGHGDASCKTAWDVRTAESSWDLSAVARFIRHHASEHGRLDMSIVPDSSMLLQALDHCTALQDAPWMYLYPSMMRSYPDSRFILTRWPSCDAWLYHFSGLAACGDGLSQKAQHNITLGSCYIDRGGPRTVHTLLESCKRHERSVVLTARALRRPLLILDNTWRDDDKWTALDRFLATSAERIASRRRLHGGRYPHVRTTECGKMANLRPRDDNVDHSNADLFAGISPRNAVLWPV